jgi:hypothetical protein
MLNNFILRHDGLDKLWESDVNWKTLNPNGNEDEDDVEEDDDILIHADEEYFIPTYHDYFVPQGSSESDKFRSFRLLLSKHLHFTYNAGKLQWPLTRSAIKKRYNNLPRLHFPNATDLNFNN